MPKVKIDGQLIEVPDGTTLLQACEMAGKEVPRFCYHERLSVAGNCRMCLVEVKGMPKPMASCALSVNDLRPGPDGEPPEVFTESEVARKARHGVLEFILINHPLDCPICDQGGECDLQDQALGYGRGESRFREAKRAVDERYISPLIKTIMTRCIKCTRCVRFIADVAGLGDLGATGRGENVEITTYLDAALNTELAGNIADICPVGALTHAPYAYHARPWELSKTETIDVMDGMGSNIRVDAKFDRILRILPRLHEDINEEWISDKTRHAWDGLRNRRLDTPWVRDDDGRLRQAGWEEALQRIAKHFPKDAPQQAAALSGPFVAAEEALALKRLMTALGVASTDCRPEHVKLGEAGGRAGYLFNATIAGIDEADAILLIGSNPRFEASVLNTRIHRAWFERDVPVGLIGAPIDVTYDYTHIGESGAALAELAAGKGAFAGVLKQAQKPLIIVGLGALMRPDGEAIRALAAKLALDCGAVSDGWNGFGVLHTDMGLVSALEAGFLPGESGRDTAAILRGAQEGEISFVWLAGVDDIDMARLGEAFVVYQGSHGDAGAARADVILPAAAWTEKNVTYVNMEGRPQLALRAVLPPGEAKEDLALIAAVAQALGVGDAVPDTPAAARRMLYETAPHLANIDAIEPAETEALKELAARAGEAEPGKAPLTSHITDFWLSNAIARSSHIMQRMSAIMQGAQGSREAAE